MKTSTKIVFKLIDEPNEARVSGNCCAHRRSNAREDYTRAGHWRNTSIIFSINKDFAFLLTLSRKLEGKSAAMMMMILAAHLSFCPDNTINQLWRLLRVPEIFISRDISSSRFFIYFIFSPFQLFKPYRILIWISFPRGLWWFMGNN